MHSANHREKNIKTAAWLNIFFTAIEVVGGLWTNSLAILSDALHDFGDSLALLTAWLAEKKAQQPPDTQRTFGYQRFSLFAALLAGLVLLTGSLFILTETIPRLLKPEHTNAPGMIMLAIIGILINGTGVWRLKGGLSQNEKILSWHLIEDVLGWLVILIGGLIIYFWDNHIIDPIMTLGFTVFILWGAGKNIKETFNIFMQGVPNYIQINQIKRDLLKLKEVKGVHDIHIWSLEGETNIFTAHIVVNSASLKLPNPLKKKIKQILKQHHIRHSTLEFEDQYFCSGIDCS